MARRLLVVGLMITAAAFAQRGGRGGGGGGGNAPNIGFGAKSKFDSISEMLALNKDQKKDFKQTFDDAQKEAAPVHDQMSKARAAIAEAVAAGKSQDEIGRAVNAEA